MENGHPTGKDLTWWKRHSQEEHWYSPKWMRKSSQSHQLWYSQEVLRLKPPEERLVRIENPKGRFWQEKKKEEEKRMTAIYHGQLYQKRMMRAHNKKIRPKQFQEWELVLKRIPKIGKTLVENGHPIGKGPMLWKRLSQEEHWYSPKWTGKSSSVLSMLI